MVAICRIALANGQWTTMNSQRSIREFRKRASKSALDSKNVVPSQKPLSIWRKSNVNETRSLLALALTLALLPEVRSYGSSEGGTQESGVAGVQEEGRVKSNANGMRLQLTLN